MFEDFIKYFIGLIYGFLFGFGFFVCIWKNDIANKYKNNYKYESNKKWQERIRRKR